MLLEMDKILATKRNVRKKKNDDFWDEFLEINKLI